MIGALSSGLMSFRQPDMPTTLTEMPDSRLGTTATIEPQKKDSGGYESRLAGGASRDKSG